MAIKSYVKNGKKLFLVQIKTRDQLGKQILKRRVAITSEKKAQDIEFELKKELENRSTGQPSTKWSAWLDRCMTQMQMELRGSTVENYQGILGKWVTPVWKDRNIQEISRSDIYQLVFKDVGDLASTHTKRNVLKMVKRILQMACEENLLDRNPSLGISIKVPELDLTVLTSSEVEQFLGEARLVGHRFYPVWAMALMTGMRSGELFALSWNDVDFDSSLIRVNKAWSSKNGITATKTRTCRVVPISEDLTALLRGLKLVSDGAGHVLPRLWEWEQGQQALITREFCKAANVTPVRFHDLRATFITNLLAKGVSLAKVMAVVGHAEIKTTNGYLRKAGVDVQGSTDALGYKLPGEIEGNVLSFSGTWKGR